MRLDILQGSTIPIRRSCSNVESFYQNFLFTSPSIFYRNCGNIETFFQKFLFSTPSSFCRPRLCQPLRLTIIALVSDEKNQQASTSSASETEPSLSASNSDLVDLWSSLSAFIHVDDEDSNAMHASEAMLGLSASLFDDFNSLDMEDEEPATYVPPPPIHATDSEMNMKVQDALYIFKDVLAGPMKKVGMRDECIAAWRLVNADVKVEDPLFCIEGKKRLHNWLKTLADAGTVVDLHEIYSEDLTAFQFNRWIHAIWTLSLTEDLSKSLTEAGLWDWWTLNYDAFLHESHCSSQINPRGITPVQRDGNNVTTSHKNFVLRFPVGLPSSAERTPLHLKLSGESKFELDDSGKVLSIESAWYIKKDQGKEMLDVAKLWLLGLLNKEASD